MLKLGKKVILPLKSGENGQVGKWVKKSRQGGFSGISAKKGFNMQCNGPQRRAETLSWSGIQGLCPKQMRIPICSQHCEPARNKTR
jgi:hypothetical protein